MIDDKDDNMESNILEAILGTKTKNMTRLRRTTRTI